MDEVCFYNTSEDDYRIGMFLVKKSAGMQTSNSAKIGVGCLLHGRKK